MNQSLKYETPFPERRHVVIYHAACADGFCAAVLLWEALVKHSDITNVVIIPMHYGQPIPSNLCLNDVVYLVDFSYKRDVMYELCKLVHYVYVLDHHKTAEKELAQLKLTNTSVFFDMKRSGAAMVFDFIQCMKTGLIHQLEDTLPLPKSHLRMVPHLVEYVQDRDLWEFELPYSKEVSVFLRSIPFNLDNWAKMLDPFVWEDKFDTFVKEGAAILRFQQIQINGAVDKAVDVSFPLSPGASYGVSVKIVNTTVNHSEVGEELCLQYDLPFAVTWFHRSDGKFQYSLRSRGGYDVSEIAKAYGGGGHPAAAGFESDVLIQGIE